MLSGVGILVTSFVLTALFGRFLLPLLHKWHFGQSIRECGPKEHLKKSGTPTMGGLMMIAAAIAASLLWIPLYSRTIVALWLFVGYGLIGFIDDGLKIFFKRNLGLTSKQKMALQILVAAVYLFYPGDVTVYSTRIWVPLVNTTVDLGTGYYLFLLLLLVGTTNAVNLTDGLDGLASSVTIPVMLAFAYIGFASGLLPEALFALSIVGCCLGFLIYNHHPAKCFMGDTGSLALGGAVLGCIRILGGGLQSLQSGTTDDRGIVAREVILAQQLTDLHLDQIQQLLVVDHIALVHKDNDIGHADLTSQQDVLTGLGHGTIGSSNDQNSAVHLSSTGDHVLNVVSMARAVNVSVVTSIGLVLDMSGVDRNTTSALLGSLIDVGIVHEVCVALQCQILGDSGGQSGLAVVNVTDGADVNMRLRTVKFCLFSHWNILP